MMMHIDAHGIVVAVAMADGLGMRRSAAGISASDKTRVADICEEANGGTVVGEEETENHYKRGA